MDVPAGDRTTTRIRSRYDSLVVCGRGPWKAVAGFFLGMIRSAGAGAAGAGAGAAQLQEQWQGDLLGSSTSTEHY